MGSDNGNKGNLNVDYTGHLTVDQLQRETQDLRQIMSDHGAFSAQPDRVSNQRMLQESPGVRSSARETSSGSVPSLGQGAFETFREEVDIRPDFPKYRMPKQTPPTFDGRGEIFKQWLKVFKRYSLHYDFYPAYANKLGLDMSHPYSAY